MGTGDSHGPDLTSAFLVGRDAARHMIPRGRGKIINICSVQTDLARPTIAPYVAAKGSLRNLTRVMTAERAGSRLQINGIAPGYIHTEMTQNLVEKSSSSSAKRNECLRPQGNRILGRRTTCSRSVRYFNHE